MRPRSTMKTSSAGAPSENSSVPLGIRLVVPSAVSCCATSADRPRNSSTSLNVIGCPLPCCPVARCPSSVHQRRGGGRVQRLRRRVTPKCLSGGLLQPDVALDLQQQHLNRHNGRRSGKTVVGEEAG